MNAWIARNLRPVLTRPERASRSANRSLCRVLWRTSLPGLVFPSGCSRAPAQNILGSFFPSWILCTLIGIAAAAAARLLLGAAGLDRHVLAPPLAYLAVAIAVALFTWLIQFGQ